MRASITRADRVMLEGAYYRTLKARAEIIEGSANDLLWDLAIYKYAL